MKTQLFLLLVAAALLSFSACKDDNWKPGDLGDLRVEFNHMAGAEDLVLNTGSYTNAVGEDFKVSLLQYFVSNVKLINEDGSTFTVPQDECYFLIKEQDADTRTITLKDVPAGNYTGIEFVLGIDSLRNTKEPAERTGALDVGGAAAGMYWSWNSGYIFLKLEGTSSKAPMHVSGANMYQYHIGGFGGYSVRTINNIKHIRLDFGMDNAEVRKHATPEVHVIADILKVFTGTENVSIEANPVVMFASYSTKIADNYAQMFRVEHVYNEGH